MTRIPMRGGTDDPNFPLRGLMPISAHTTTLTASENFVPVPSLRVVADMLEHLVELLPPIHKTRDSHDSF